LGGGVYSQNMATGLGAGCLAQPTPKTAAKRRRFIGSSTGRAEPRLPLRASQLQLRSLSISQVDPDTGRF